jgi:hypothetical protein
LQGLHSISTPFTKEEIDNVIKKLPIDKAPGSDGFNGCFLKTCWEIVAPEFYSLCQELLKEMPFWVV